MAGVEDDGVVRRVEHPVQGQRQFDDAEVGAEMSAGRSDLVDQELTNLEREFVQLRLRKVLQISGSADLFKHPVSLRTLQRTGGSSLVDVGHTVVVCVGGLASWIRR